MRGIRQIAASRPYAAVGVVVLALVAALVGTGVAAGPGATTSAVSKKAVKKLVKKEVRRQISKARGPQGPPGPEGPPGPPGEPATALFAGIESNGDPTKHKGLEEVIHNSGSGTYAVVFDRDVSDCVPIASLSHDDLGLIQASTLGGGNDTVTVYTASDTGALGDQAFNLAVFC